ncbi:hypothetical protein BH10CYA1_BH10CYA1_38230 [soil metagenome]
MKVKKPRCAEIKETLKTNDKSVKDAIIMTTNFDASNGVHRRQNARLVSPNLTLSRFRIKQEKK